MDEDTTAPDRGPAASPAGPSPQFSLVVLLLAAAVAYVGLSGFDQSLRAARGEGAPGTFTASSITCVQHPGHESCTCTGSFAPHGGAEPRGVYLHAAGQDTCVVGSQIPAVDVGADSRVYGPDGSREWVLSSLLLVVPLAVVASVAVRWVRHLLRSGSAAGR